jgi:hypothetical protein
MPTLTFDGDLLQIVESLVILTRVYMGLDFVVRGQDSFAIACLQVLGLHRRGDADSAGHHAFSQSLVRPRVLPRHIPLRGSYCYPATKSGVQTCFSLFTKK